MEFPNKTTYESTIYNKEKKQQEAIIEHAISVSYFKILDHNKFTVEELSTIDFHVKDSQNRIFNKDTLAALINPSKNESEEFHIQLLNGIEAIPPFTFIFKSETLNLANVDFQISWKTKN